MSVLLVLKHKKKYLFNDCLFVRYEEIFNSYWEFHFKDENLNQFVCLRFYDSQIRTIMFIY